jgi:hypothetical protein
MIDPVALVLTKMKGLSTYKNNMYCGYPDKAHINLL